MDDFFFMIVIIINIQIATTSAMIKKTTLSPVFTLSIILLIGVVVFSLDEPFSNILSVIDFPPFSFSISFVS